MCSLNWDVMIVNMKNRQPNGDFFFLLSCNVRIKNSLYLFIYPIVPYNAVNKLQNMRTMRAFIIIIVVFLRFLKNYWDFFFFVIYCIRIIILL